MLKWIFTLFFCTFSNSVFSQIEWGKIEKFCGNFEVHRIEFTYSLSHINEAGHLTPELLEEKYSYKFYSGEMKSFGRSGNYFYSPHRDSICQALLSAKGKIREIHSSLSYPVPDVRWGIILYDRGNTRLLSIYLSRDGSEGYIDAKSVEFTGENPLYQFLVKTLLPHFK